MHARLSAISTADTCCPCSQHLAPRRQWWRATVLRARSHIHSHTICAAAAAVGAAIAIICAMPPRHPATRTRMCSATRGQLVSHCAPACARWSDGTGDGTEHLHGRPPAAPTATPKGGSLHMHGAGTSSCRTSSQHSAHRSAQLHADHVHIQSMNAAQLADALAAKWRRNP